MTDERKGFELKLPGQNAAHFYEWHVSDSGKDLLLIDGIAQMPATSFFDLIEDEFEASRSPVLLALIATSLRHAHPDWSHQRVERTVLNLSLSEVEIIGGEDEEDEPDPPAEAGAPSPASSTSPPAGSSPSAASQSLSPTSESSTPIPEPIPTP